LSHFGEHLCARVLADVVGDGQGSECSPTLGVNGPLGNPLAVLMGQFLDQLIVVDGDRSVPARRFRILVVRNGVAGGGGKPGRGACPIALSVAALVFWGTVDLSFFLAHMDLFNLMVDGVPICRLKIANLMPRIIFSPKRSLRKGSLNHWTGKGQRKNDAATRYPSWLTDCNMWFLSCR